ncbi:DNA polymerase epsilon, subunit B [Cyanidioschyzon merolae strain 10D]|uniref:DNA polymerase II subunit 2 n=1 Tax=Cyanidioschyzon merolae (strain NIES-3377 / 10D) TaxID=280699 RepID=M1VBN0_CYAM1|nr:DNA polymerase epsilon, subunit B [Cyanidioschyzon merolae strain 10D]BAM79772.1 DNA polymerase epsilon, subunit B [Cyanidioschyzon merolae strain 10D]|eukprot:XP_005536058.1 DNA polymerase epsilon, subunit B [Cyanidioschyzon merolae strain 10D]
MSVDPQTRVLVDELHRLGFVVEPAAVYLLQERFCSDLELSLLDEEERVAALASLVQRLRETALEQGTRTISTEAVERTLKLGSGGSFGTDRSGTGAGITKHGRVNVANGWKLHVTRELKETDLLQLPPIAKRREALAFRYQTLYKDLERCLQISALRREGTTQESPWPRQVVPVGVLRSARASENRLQIVMGMLSAQGVDEWLLEDPTGSIALRLHGERSAVDDYRLCGTKSCSLVCAGCMLVVIGVYDPIGDAIVVRELRQPPLCPDWSMKLLPLEETPESSAPLSHAGDLRFTGTTTLDASLDAHASDCSVRLPHPESPQVMDASRGNLLAAKDFPEVHGDVSVAQELQGNVSLPRADPESEVESLDDPDGELHILFAADLALDDSTSYAKWRKLLRELYLPNEASTMQGTSTLPPTDEAAEHPSRPEASLPHCIFVLCGPFLGSKCMSWPPVTEPAHEDAPTAGAVQGESSLTPNEQALLLALRRFGKMLAAFRAPLRSSGSEFILIPAERDMDCFGEVLPRPPLSNLFVETLRVHSGLRTEQIRTLSDPARFDVLRGERCRYSVLVHATERLCERLAAEALPWPAEREQRNYAADMQQFASNVFRTILHQRHVAPLPVYKQPIFWTFDRQYLWTLTDPNRFVDFLVLADNTLPLCMETYAVGGFASLAGGLEPSMVLCIAPGSFSRDGTAVWIRLTGQAQQRIQPRSLHLVAGQQAEPSDL